MWEHGRVGLFDRLKDLTAPPVPSLPDELPPWLREAIPPTSQTAWEEPPPGAGAADGGLADPYRRAPPRGTAARARPSRG
jgi:hypothetical protein